MTRKDYELIAKAIDTSLDKHWWGGEEFPEGTDILRCLVRDLAEALVQDNPAFDRDKFVSACGF